MNAPATITVNAIIVPPELEKAVDNTGLTIDGAQTLKAGFAPHFIRFHELAEIAKGIQPTAPKAARELRLELRAIRVAADKTRKSLKEDSLRRGKAIDGINALLEYQLVPVEERMEAIEKAEEIAEAKRKDALKAARCEELAPYADVSFYDLVNMPGVQWDLLLSGAKSAHEAKIAAAKKAEDDRVAAELAEAQANLKRAAEEAAERERMRGENERLAKLAAEERAAREASEAKARAEREAIERKAAAEREQAKKEQDAADAKARAEIAEAAQRLAVEVKKREAAEAQVLAKQAEERAAAKRAAAAPDREKVVALAKSFRAIQVPKLDGESGAALAVKIGEQVAKFAAWLDVEAGKL